MYASRYISILAAFAAGAVLSAGAAQVADLSRDGVEIVVSAEPERVDLARDFFVTVSYRFPAPAHPGETPSVPDLRDRFQGFSVAEDFDDAPVVAKDGSASVASRWRLVPEPCARRYRLAPFVVRDFHTVPVVFEPPAARDPVEGGMEVDPRKDLPPMSWRLAGFVAAALAALALAAAAAWWACRRVALAVKVRRMSPVQRAYYELDKLLRRGLPGRGLYKDFYVELTMVVRRYVQRKYGIRAPHLTTEEFLHEISGGGAPSAIDAAALRAFLESADLVKFAGADATPATADAAAVSARDYIAADNASPPAAAAARPPA